MRRTRIIFHTSTLGVILMLTLAACQPSTSTSQQQEVSRNSAMDRADSRVPVPITNNFIARETVAEYMRRMDVPDKLFYVYVLADTGNILGYYVSQGHPVNICTFMTPTDRIYKHSYGNVARPAPALDGLYYGSGACNTEYFFDAETDALVALQGMKLFIADQPLELDAEPITVRQNQ